MVDLEQLAIKRDRKFIVRLIILLALGICASVLLFGPLTGENVSGCVVRAFLGPAPQAPEKPKSD